MRVVFLIAIIACGSVTAIKNCKKAKDAVKEYKELQDDIDDSEVLVAERNKRNERNRLLVEAANELIESKAPYWELKKHQCGRVLEAFEYIETMERQDKSDGFWNEYIPRITVLLGGKTLANEEDDVVLRLGSRMFELLRRSRVIVARFVKSAAGKSFPTLFAELRTLRFFGTNGRNIANKLLSGLDTFENGLKYWESMREAAAAPPREKRGWFSGTRKREIFFRSYPPGYVLGAICEVTFLSSLTANEIDIAYGPYFGTSFATWKDVVDAIERLADFSEFANTNWMKSLASRKRRDLLEGILVADSIVAADPPSSMIKTYEYTTLLPGIVFMRWITGKYNKGKYEGVSRLFLAARAAKLSVKFYGRSRLGDNRFLNFEDRVLNFLDESDDNRLLLEQAFAWINEPRDHLRGNSGLDIDFAASFLNTYAKENAMNFKTN